MGFLAALVLSQDLGIAKLSLSISSFFNNKYLKVIIIILYNDETNLF